MFCSHVETHLQHLRIPFDGLREADLKLKEIKCYILKVHVWHYGHFICGKGIEPVPEKLKNIKHMTCPTNVTNVSDVKEVKQFLGLVGYYRKFIPHFADHQRPPTTPTRKDVSIELTTQCQDAFDLLKQSLVGELLL